MATQPTVRVSLGSNNPTKVTIGQNDTKVASLSYGSRTLKSASDLSLVNAQDGFGIVYRTTTNSFEVAPISLASVVMDNGYF